MGFFVCPPYGTKGKAWSRSWLGRAGDGARELLPPWTAGPGAQKNFDPNTSCGGLQGQKPCALLYSCLIQFVLCVLALRIPHRLPIPRGPSCTLTYHDKNVFECRGGKRSTSFSTRCTEPARCPVVCELSVVTRSPSSGGGWVLSLRARI
jgi:hypothetical protein